MYQLCTMHYNKWKPPCSTNVNAFQHCRYAVAREWIVNAAYLLYLSYQVFVNTVMTLTTCCRHSNTNRTNLCMLWRKSRHLPVRPSSGKTVHKPKFCQIKNMFVLPPLSSLKRFKRYFLTPCILVQSKHRRRKVLRYLNKHSIDEWLQHSLCDDRKRTNLNNKIETFQKFALGN